MCFQGTGYCERGKSIVDKNQLRMQIKSKFFSILQPLGFKEMPSLLYVRVTDDNVLHTVSFDLSEIGFTCAVAMQPLYFYDYDPVISFNMGNRLSRFKIVQKEWWVYDDAVNGLEEIERLLRKNGLPWFDEFGSPEGIIRFIVCRKAGRYRFRLFDSFLQNLYFRFIFLLIYFIHSNFADTK